MLIKNRTLHRMGEHRITFGVGADGLEFRIADQGGCYITGAVVDREFVASNRGSDGPDSVPCFNQQRKDALGKALLERNGGGGSMLADRDEG